MDAADLVGYSFRCNAQFAPTLCFSQTGRMNRTVVRSNRDTRICHLARSIRADGAVSAMCFTQPRAIDMSRATWTTNRKAVTCHKCSEIIKHLMAGKSPPDVSGDK